MPYQVHFMRRIRRGPSSFRLFEIPVTETAIGHPLGFKSKRGQKPLEWPEEGRAGYETAERTAAFINSRLDQTKGPLTVQRGKAFPCFVKV